MFLDYAIGACQTSPFGLFDGSRPRLFVAGRRRRLMTVMTRIERVCFRAALALVGTIVFASSAKAGPASALANPQEVAVRFAYGIGDRESLRFFTLGPRVAYDLPDWIPAIAGNRLRIALEANGSFIHGDHHPRDGEFALSPLIFDYRYDRGIPFVPFIEGGEGIVLTTLDRIHIGGPFEFSSQGGGGFHLFFTYEDAITFSFRIRHISNSGIKSENSGLNTYFFAVGLSHFPDRR
jgi:hypothetical protein